MKATTLSARGSSTVWGNMVIFRAVAVMLLQSFPLIQLGDLLDREAFEIGGDVVGIENLAVEESFGPARW